MCKEIPLSRGMVALVSDEDYERVSQCKWSYDTSNGYAVRNERQIIDGKVCRRKVLLHRFLMDAPAGMQVDHRNRQRLDCQRHNMRLVTHAQNCANSGPRKGQYKGVSWHERDQVWRADIGVGRRQIHLGVFTCAEEAARAVDMAAIAIKGECTYLNFPGGIASHTPSVALASD